MVDTFEPVARKTPGAPKAPAAVVPAPDRARAGDGRWEFLLAGIGMLILFLPTYYDLARSTWTDPHEAHGPFILAIAFGAAFARWKAFLAARGCAPWAGSAILFFGLVLYVLGRSQEFLVLETMSQIPVLAGAILLLKGWQGLKVFWFPVLFLCFSIVWPTWVIDPLTMPLKQAATDFTVHVLRYFDYPIGATGVIIMVGRYQLLVADACSGLNTIVSLLSVGVLYLYLVKRASVLWNLVILIATPLIAFAANVLRIFGLTLITYHFGERAGESFLHDFTGLFLFGVALVLVFLLDLGIERLVGLRKRMRERAKGAAP